MKVVILAGGLGTRLGQETALRPKPMVEVGEHPILWHIMKIYSHFGFNDFIVCLGYKGYVIKEYFANYCLHSSNVTIDLAKNSIEYEKGTAMPWRVTLLDTGADSLTGRRLARVEPYVKGERFMMTYGDGVGSIEIHELIRAHERGGKLVTVTCPRPAGRFGLLDIEDDGKVLKFQEKPEDGGGWINGGFFVMEPGVFPFIEGNVMFEREPMVRLVDAGQLNAYKHPGYWQCMDTARDRDDLDQAWKSGAAPWRMWKD